MIAPRIQTRAKQFIRDSFLGEMLCRASLNSVREKPLEEWPGWVGRICGIHLPKKVVRRRIADTTGGANINIVLNLVRRCSSLDGDIAECGVFQGATLIPIGLYVKQADLQKSVFGLDSFEGFGEDLLREADRKEGRERAKQVGLFSNTSLSYVKRQIKIFGLDSQVKLIPGVFDQTLKQLAGHRFCFVHLDCDLYESYKVCLEFFYPRMLRDGIILLDEYDDPLWPGCNKAVDEFLMDKEERCVPVESDRYIKYFIQKDQ